MLTQSSGRARRWPATWLYLLCRVPAQGCFCCHFSDGDRATEPGSNLPKLQSSSPRSHTPNHSVRQKLSLLTIQRADCSSTCIPQVHAGKGSQGSMSMEVWGDQARCLRKRSPFLGVLKDEYEFSQARREGKLIPCLKTRDEFYRTGVGRRKGRKRETEC